MLCDPNILNTKQVPLLGVKYVGVTKYLREAVLPEVDTICTCCVVLLGICGCVLLGGVLSSKYRTEGYCHTVMQVMHMGTPVTSLSLSSSQDLLATAHINKRGVFLWSNQLMFGDPSAVATYTDKPVPVHLPMLAAASSKQQQHDSGKQQRDQVAIAGGKRGAADDDSSSSSDDESEESDISHDVAGENLLPGREVRMLIDGGAVTDDDESSDFYESGSDDSESEDADVVSSSDDEAAAGVSSSDEDVTDGEQQQKQRKQKQRRQKRSRRQRAAEEAAALAAAVYKQTDVTGAPAPLAPNLATLSLLPRSQVRQQTSWD